MSAPGTVHVVGAGVAGLAAAHALLKAGRAVTLYEGAPGAGGRARALPDGTDNGTHALIGANRAALRFLDETGGRAGWIEPEPDGLPVLDRADGSRRIVALSPFGWWRADRRPAGVSPRAVAALARLALPGPDVTVGAAMAAHPDFLRGFVDPLTIAALNTPVREAGTRRLAQVLRRLGAPGATRLYVARRGLGPDLVEPALAAIARLGGAYRGESRLRALTVSAGRATALHLGGAEIALGAGDAVVLALPPWEGSRLLPDLPAPALHAPIVNLHFAHATPGPVRFLGLLGALCQWVLVRPGGVSVTVSAGDAEAGEAVEALAPRAWAEIVEAARGFGVSGEWPDAPPPCRVVKERRATPRQGPGAVPVPPRRPLANLALAGDWTWPHLPATIEAAVQSGLAAAKALAR
jgi:hypothetical protein